MYGLTGLSGSYRFHTLHRLTQALSDSDENQVESEALVPNVWMPTLVCDRRISLCWWMDKSIFRVGPSHAANSYLLTDSSYIMWKLTTHTIPSAYRNMSQYSYIYHFYRDVMFRFSCFHEKYLFYTALINVRILWVNRKCFTDYISISVSLLSWSSICILDLFTMSQLEKTFIFTIMKSGSKKTGVITMSSACPQRPLAMLRHAYSVS